GLHDARAVDRLGDLVGVLGDDGEEVGDQLALERREVVGDVGDRPVRVVGAVDRAVAGDGDRDVGLRRPARDRRLGARAVLLSRAQAASRIVSLVRNRSPSSSLRW
ncbi:MAG TPA: hypothetical protein VNO82_23595, partial [Solirubrobacteraceae bacterium]|nr:hypothetical protein [Solirubrobacteraceae bacterium]